MPKTVLVALLLICAVTYVVMFTMWNPQVVTVFGWRLGQDYWQKMPIAYTALLGVAIGIVLMCVVGLFSWVATRGRIKRASSQIGKAKVVIEQQRKRIAQLEDTVANLRQAEASAREAASEPEPSAAVVPAATASQATPTAVADPSPSAEAPGDDDEVI